MEEMSLPRSLFAFPASNAISYLSNAICHTPTLAVSRGGQLNTERESLIAKNFFPRGEWENLKRLALIPNVINLSPQIN